jgi:hypothetical protein
MQPITDDPQVLLDQASSTADLYLRKAITHIDNRFGKGYAQAHPKLVATFMQTAAMEFQTSVYAAVAQDLTEGLTTCLCSFISSATGDGQRTRQYSWGDARTDKDRALRRARGE